MCASYTHIDCLLRHDVCWHNHSTYILLSCQADHRVAKQLQHATHNPGGKVPTSAAKVADESKNSNFNGNNKSQDEINVATNITIIVLDMLFGSVTTISRIL